MQQNATAAKPLKPLAYRRQRTAAVQGTTTNWCHLTDTRLCHRLRGSASPVLTATHHSYGSPRLSDFFSRLWGSDPSTDIHAKWLKRRVFTQGCAFCSKSRYFSCPLIYRAPKRSKFCKFLDLEIFRSILAFNHSIYMREAQVYATPLAAVVAHILAVHRQRTWRP